MATTIFFNGRTIATPGSYSEVDASGLESVGLSATGIVAVIGTAEGGKPVSEISESEDFLRATTPSQMRAFFKSGDLREVGDMLFAPSNDPDIQGGAVEVVAMKVNPATASEAVFANAYGNALKLVSKDYGAFTDQINVSIGNGTTQGKLLTIAFEDTVETVDNLGAGPIFSLTYTNPGTGWTSMDAQVEFTGDIVSYGERDGLVGKDNEILVQPLADSILTITSDDGADIGQQIVLYGVNDVGVGVTETKTLNGVFPVTTTFSYSKLCGARIIGTTAGTVSIEDDDPATIASIAPDTNPEVGLTAASTMYMANTFIALVSDDIDSSDVIVVGKNPSGAVQVEKITMTDVTPVEGTALWSEIDYLALGDVSAANTLSAFGEAARSLGGSTHNTVKKAADYYNAKSITGGGFTFTIITGLTNLNVTNLDVTVSVVSCLNPTVLNFYADLWSIVNWVNNNSSLVTASAVTGAQGGAPSNTATPVFLGGGSEGIPSFADWQKAINLLKKVRVNTVVPLTGDPAVHAAVDAHCAYMGGIGKSERDAFVGMLNTALTDVPTKSELKAQIVDLNSRHIRAMAQAVERFNTAGEREEFPPPFMAAIAAGMQAGSAIGESLTYKLMNVLKLRQSSTWNPVDDGEDLIQSGLFFGESVDGVGRRVVRNITTHLSSNNLAFIEGSVNEAVNFATYNFRTNMEFVVGAKGFSGTIAAGKSVAENTLSLLVDSDILVTYRSLTITTSADVMEVAVEIAAIIPINFVKNTIHLVAIQQSA